MRPLTSVVLPAPDGALTMKRQPLISYGPKCNCERRTSSLASTPTLCFGVERRRRARALRRPDKGGHMFEMRCLTREIALIACTLLAATAAAEGGSHHWSYGGGTG